MSVVKEGLLEWSNEKLRDSGRTEMTEIEPLRQEASTREYFRLKGKENSYIGVFSPPKTELNEQFIFLSKFLHKQGITVPEVLYSDLTTGRMLLEDFGDDTYKLKLNKKNFHHLFSAAIDEIIGFHSCPPVSKIPSLGEKEIENHMLLFEEWFLNTLLEEKLSSDEKKLFSNLYREILNDLKDQPKVLCHFDFESRNLMVLPNGNAGVLDFQDAVFGPIFLDPVALFKDLYLNINDKEVGALLGEYISRSDEIGLDQELEIEDAIRSFDLTGLQRQLRILGTISRLHLRDNKSFRLPDLHKTLNFVVEACSKSEELNEVSSYLKKKIVPLLTHTLKKIL